MISRHSLAVTSLIVIWASTVVADEPNRQRESTWIRVSQTPSKSNARQRFEVSASKDAPRKIRDTIAAFLSRSTDLPIVLLGRTELDLKFETENFLITSVKGRDLMLGPGSEFPARTTHSLAKRLADMGFQVVVAAPDAVFDQLRATAEMAGQDNDDAP